jgi:hypothetical protein
LLHVCDWNAWIRTYNVTDPSYPVLISSWGGSGSTDIDVVGKVAYIAAGAFGVQIWNVSNPLIPLVITSIPIGPNVTTTEVQGPHLYVGLDFGGAGPGLQIYDISTIALPVLTSQFFLTSLVYDLDIDGDVLHMADGTWYVLWNVTEPFNPWYHILSGYLPTEPFRNIGVEGFGPYCLTTNGSSGITLVDGRNMNLVSPMAINPSVTFARGITIHGDYAYVATNHSFEIIHLFRSAAGTYQTGTAFAQSLNVATTTDLIINATLNFDAYMPTGTTLSFAMSADGGLHWETVTPGVKHIFAYPGHDLRWTANLTTSHNDASVRLFEVTIDYEHAPVVIPTIPLPWWWWIAVLVIIIILVVVILVVLLRRRRK